jgi:hypothetical protein
MGRGGVAAAGRGMGETWEASRRAVHTMATVAWIEEEDDGQWAASGPTGVDGPLAIGPELRENKKKREK